MRLSLILALAGSILFANIGSAIASQGDQGANVLSPVGQQAFTDISTCLTSGKSPSLDVYYLIDNSGSLSYTDKGNVRQQVIESSVSQLKNFADSGVKVNYAASTFASGVSQISSWAPLKSPSDFQGATSKIHREVNNQHLAGYTNWLGGMQEALSAFQTRGTDSCKMLIWFTDGGINPTGTTNDISKSLKALCGDGIGPSSVGEGRGNFGLMAKLREQGVSIFGVLYQNDASTLEQFNSDFKNKTSNGLTGPKRLELEHYLMSYMVPLVEGSGEIPNSEVAASFALPSGGHLSCSPVGANGLAPAGSPNGAFLNAQDPVGLSFQFLSLQNSINGGKGSAILNGSFAVPAGTAGFSVLTEAQNWKLDGPSGSGISISPASISKTGSWTVETSAGVTQIAFKVEDQKKLEGPWTFTGGGPNSQLFLYSGLTINLDRDKQSQVVAGRSNTLTGQIARTKEFQNLPIDLNRFPRSVLSLKTLDDQGNLQDVSDVKVILNPVGQFKIENFKPSGNQKSVNLWLALDLSGGFQQVQSQFDVSLVDAQALTVPAADVVRMTALNGPKGTATGTLTLTGPSVGSAPSYFCLDSAAIRTSDVQTGSSKTDRTSSFKWTFNGKSQSPQFCIQVNQGKTVDIAVQARNPIQADSNVVSIRSFSSKTGAAKLTGTIQFEFESKALVNPWAMALSIMLLLILGLALPILAMYAFNKLTTKFLPAVGMVSAEIPVKFNASGPVRLLDARPNSSSETILVSAQDFRPLASNPKATKEVNLQTAGAGVVRVKLWPPLSSPWFELVSRPNSRSISVFRGARKNSELFQSGKTQEISPNLADFWSLVIPESEVIRVASLASNSTVAQPVILPLVFPPGAPGAVQSTVISSASGSAASQNQVSATLIVFARMGKLSEYQERLNLISNDASLEKRFDLIKKDLAKPAKPQKVKKSKPASESKSNGFQAEAVQVVTPPPPPGAAQNVTAPMESVPFPPPSGATVFPAPPTAQTGNSGPLLPAPPPGA